MLDAALFGDLQIGGCSDLVDFFQNLFRIQESDNAEPPLKAPGVANAEEPNVHAVAKFVKAGYPDLMKNVRCAPSMDALASRWVHRQKDGVIWTTSATFLVPEIGRSTSGWLTRASHASVKDSGSRGVSSRQRTSRTCMCMACRLWRSMA